jgi:hypothetical protein
MTRKDRAALQLALKMMRRDPMRAKQLDDMLAAGRSWQEVAEFASYSMQFRTLRLKPWEVPPIDAEDKPGGEARSTVSAISPTPPRLRYSSA